MRLNRTNIAVAFIPTLLALAARLYGLADKPLWLDEIITQKRALLPIPDLIANSFANGHIPTYFVLVRAFDAPIIDEAMLRLPSVIFGCIAVMLVALVATEIRSPRAGLVAGLLMALSPIDVQFSQEARSYALVSCLIMLALWGLIRIAKQETINSSPAPRRGTRTGWAAYVIGTIGALNVLLVSVFWLLASNLAIAVMVLRIGAGRAALVRRWFVAQSIVVLVWLPALLATVFANHNDPLRGYRWIPASTLEHVSSVLAAVYLYRASNIVTFELLPSLVPWLGAATLALALFGAWRLKADANVLYALGLATITMPVAMLVMSIFQPFWVPRYLLWSTGPLFALAGIGAAALPRAGYAVTAAVILVGGIVNLAPYYHAETKPRWDLAAAYLAAHAQPDDTIVVNNSFAKSVLAAYGDRYRLAQPIVDGGNVARAAAHIAPQGRVWIVFGRVGQAIRVSESGYLSQWSALGAPGAMIRFGRDVVAFRFDAPRRARDSAS